MTTTDSTQTDLIFSPGDRVRVRRPESEYTGCRGTIAQAPGARDEAGQGMLPLGYFVAIDGENGVVRPFLRGDLEPVRPVAVRRRGVDAERADRRAQAGVVGRLSVHADGQGLHEFTDRLAAWVEDSGVSEGLCTIFVQHTSASLVIQENADPSAARDLERWLCRLVAEDDPLYTHTAEGPDDMPAHIKAALTATSLSVPVIDGRLALGTWQGVFLWEHRHHRGERRIAVHIGP